MPKNFFQGKQGGLNPLTAMLQQDPRIEALRRAGGISGPPIPQIPDSLLSQELQARTVRPPGYVDPGGPPPPTPKLPFSMPQKLQDLGYVPMEGVDPDELRANAQQMLQFHAKDQPQRMGAEPGGPLERQQLIDWLRSQQEGPYKTLFGRYMDSSDAVPQLAAITKGSPDEAAKAARDIFGAVQRQSGDVRLFGDKLQLPPYVKGRDQLEGYLSRLSPIEQLAQQASSSGGAAGADKFAGAFGGVEGGDDQEGAAQPLSLAERLSQLDRDTMAKNAKDPAFQGFSQLVPPGLDDAIQETVNEYGIKQNEFDKATAAIKKEFEDTPEIDAALAGAQAALAMAKAERRQPTAWDFMAMALLNFSGMPPQTSYTLVLGLDDQRQREGMLEQRVMGLHDAQASGRMTGRREMRKDRLEQILAQVDADVAATKEAGLQGRFDREEKFKYDNMKRSLMQGLMGQEAQILGGMASEQEKKKAAEKRSRLLKAMGLSDQDLDKVIQQQQQQELERQRQQDQRQSRMFSTLNGGGYA